MADGAQMTARPSPASDAAYAALVSQAGRTARAMIMDRARSFERRPIHLEAIGHGFAALPPGQMVLAVTELRKQVIGQRWFAFGGKIPAINLRAALLYARYARAKAHGGGTHGL